MFEHKISVFFFLVSPSIQKRERIVPSMRISCPFFKNCAAKSAKDPKTQRWCHSTCSTDFPSSEIHDSFVAKEKVVTDFPEGVVFPRGASPSRPIRKTLFKLCLFIVFFPDCMRKKNNKLCSALFVI